jgi:hypothetical protein
MLSSRVAPVEHGEIAGNGADLGRVEEAPRDVAAQEHRACVASTRIIAARTG